jgi:hypothetical protein
MENEKTPQEQLEQFDYYEDKVKSLFMTKNNIRKWNEYLEKKYPALKIRFQIGNDVLIATARIKTNINENDNKSNNFVDRFMKENYPLFSRNKSFIKKNKVFDGFIYRPSEDSKEWFAKYWLDGEELELNKEIFKTYEDYVGGEHWGAFLEWFNNEFDANAQYLFI